MRMPEPLFALVQAFAARYPVPTGLPGEAHEEACRGWTTQLCQQAAWSFPAARYGSKRAAPDRPLSKDVLAQQTATGLVGWDVLVGAGTGLPAVISAPPEALALPGQVFVAVEGINWIDAPAPGPTPEPPGKLCEECKLVLERLDVLVDAALHQNALLSEAVTALLAWTRPQPDGTARVAAQIDQRVKIGW